MMPQVANVSVRRSYYESGKDIYSPSSTLTTIK